MALTRRDFVRGVAAVGAGAALAQVNDATAATSAPTGATRQATTTQTADGVQLHWLDGRAASAAAGVTWGVSWPRGSRAKEAPFSLADAAGKRVPVQTWPLAFWPDGSLKWTAHAAGPAALAADSLTVSVGEPARKFQQLNVAEQGDRIDVDTGVIRCSIPKSGAHLISEIARDGKPTLANARLVCLRDDAPANGAAGQVTRQAFASRVDQAIVEQNGPIRAVVRLTGMHADGNRAWLPFTIRLYFYAGSDAVRLMHTFVFDGDEKADFIAGLGVQFDVPMRDLPHDRHVRFGGAERGLWAESVRNLSGLRRDPGRAFIDRQVAGEKCPPVETMASAVRDRLNLIPAWDGFSLFQSTSDAFTITKRTGGKDVCWLTAGHGRRASGLGYVGGASGGVAFGQRYFWERHPTELSIVGAATDNATVTCWLYSPQAPAMDLRFYHDGMGMETHPQELEGLEITYEDYEKGFGTPFGVARTNELMLWALPATPTRERLADMGEALDAPPMLVCAPEHYHASGVFAPALWSLPDRSTPLKQRVEQTFDWYFDYYRKQVEQRRWFGFWDHGDVMHTYDPARHQWRYDVGGFAWDNSELSPDLWLWYSFLRTGSRDVFRFAEAMTRHTGEVDVYHIGKLRRLGTRHGVRHWGDSAKQLRISMAAYRRFYYYLTGGDERVGDLLRELVTADETFLAVDPIRKIRKGEYTPEPHALAVGFGTDWGSLAAAWLTEWERTGNETCRDKLLAGMRSIAAMPYGFFSSGGATFDPATGAFTSKPGPDVAISHLSAVFGLPEIASELIDLTGDAAFEKAWLDYCTYYNADRATRKAALGFDSKSDGLTSAHSRLTAYAAKRKGDAALAARAWNEFFGDDFKWAPQRYTLQSKRIVGPAVIEPIDEAAWVSTNDTAQWALAAMQCIALVGDNAPRDLPDALRPNG